MKKIFRCILNFKKNGKPTIPLHELKKNYREFLSCKIQPEDPSYIKIYEWIEAHNREFKEIPSFELLYERAQQEGNETILVNLKEMVPLIPYWGGDFRSILKDKFNEQNKDSFKHVVETTWKIASHGLKQKKKKGKKELKGISDAISFFSRNAKEYMISATDVRTEGEIRDKEVIAEAADDYQKRKRDPATKLGLFTNMNKIDEVFRGIKIGDLFIVAAYASQGKSTFAVNLGYQGICQGLNGLFVSLEMTYEEMRDMMYVLHTSNLEWFGHPKYGQLVGNMSYDKVRYGELNDLEEEFFNVSLADFRDRDDFGEYKILQSAGSNMPPSRLEMELENYRADLLDKGKNLDFLIIDYVGLMAQDKEARYGDFNIDLNNIIKRLKQLTLNFDEGRGLRVITPFQINREGYKDALKNDGLYKLVHLSNANEAERSSDGVITLFATEQMKEMGRVKFGCLKNRDGRLFQPFEANIDVNSKWIKDFAQTKEDAPGDEMSIQELNID